MNEPALSQPRLKIASSIRRGSHLQYELAMCQRDGEKSK